MYFVEIVVSLFSVIKDIICSCFFEVKSLLLGDVFGPLAYSYYVSTGRTSFLFFDFMLLVSMILYTFILSRRKASTSSSFVIYFVIVLIGAQALSLSDNLIEFVMAWVVLNVALYGLILRSVNSYAAETVVKYFLIGAVTTGLVFFGLFLHFVQYGSVYYSSIEFLVNSEITSLPVLSSAQSAAFLCVLVAFLFKLGAYPFHFYLPAMYEGVDFEVLGVITIPVKWYTFLAMLNFINAYGYASVSFYKFFLIMGLGSIFFGAYGAFVQQKLRSFWAYSYLGSIGFVFLGFTQNSLSLNITAGLVYFAVYLLTWLAIYWWLSVVRIKRFTDAGSTSLRESQCFELRYVAELVTVKNFSAKLVIVTLLFSLVGVPPTAGFFAKFSILAGLLGSSFGFFVFICALILMPVSAYNYLRLIRVLSFVDSSNVSSAAEQSSVKYGTSEVMFTIILYVFILVLPVFVFMSYVG